MIKYELYNKGEKWLGPHGSRFTKIWIYWDISSRSFDEGWYVYHKMKGEIMLSSKSDLEFLLDRYRVSECINYQPSWISCILILMKTVCPFITGTHLWREQRHNLQPSFNSDHVWEHEDLGGQRWVQHNEDWGEYGLRNNKSWPSTWCLTRVRQKPF